MNCRLSNPVSENPKKGSVFRWIGIVSFKDAQKARSVVKFLNKNGVRARTRTHKTPSFDTASGVAGEQTVWSLEVLAHQYAIAKVSR
jgi:hypothetical protein